MDVETLNKVIAELNEVIDMIESRDKIEAMYGAIVARDAVRKLLDGVRGEEAVRSQVGRS